MNVPPSSDENVSQSWLIIRTSACFVIAQKPVSSSSGCQNTGASARSRSNWSWGTPLPQVAGEEVDPLELGGGHGMRAPCCACGADGAPEGGDGGVGVDGIGVDASHHLEAQEHADDRRSRRRARGGARPPRSAQSWSDSSTPAQAAR